MKKLVAALVLALASTAFADGEVCQHPEPPAGAAAPAPAKDGVVLRGEKVPAGAATPVAELLQKPQGFDGKSVVVEGAVRRACSRKGCWMELAPTTAEKGAGVRVTFKDYGFFVPTDSAGSKARVTGVVKVATLSAEMASHYESEGATVPRGADGQPREVQLVASGVELRR
jgi:hypothetical protein